MIACFEIGHEQKLYRKCSSLVNLNFQNNYCNLFNNVPTTITSD